MELKFILEAILFTAQKPLTAAELREVLARAADDDPTATAWKSAREPAVTEALELLAGEHARQQRSYRLVCVAGAWQFVTEPEYSPWIKALFGKRARPPRLSQPALETLAIIAYRQPLTRAEIEQIRGVSVDGVMQTLLERGLIEPLGRAEVPGRPNTYGTTSLFLEYFGLRALDDLPAADELRRIPVTRPDTLLTAPAPAGAAEAAAQSARGPEASADRDPGGAMPAPAENPGDPEAPRGS